MTPLFAGIDAGTAGCTVMLFNDRGESVASGDAEYGCRYPDSQMVEQNLDEVWAGICIAARRALCTVDPRSIVSIAVASQRGSFVPVDRDMRPKMNSIVWSDRRAGREARVLEDALGGVNYERIAGTRVSPIWTCSKILWLARERPDLLAGTWKIVNDQEWILHNLGADLIATEASSATMNGMLDIALLDWSDKILGACGISRDLVLPIVPAMTAAGYISAAASEATGFPRGKPLFYGGGDQQCAAVGAGVVSEGDCELTIGTGSVALCPISAPISSTRDCIIQGAHVVPGLRSLEGISLSSGDSLRWWRDVAYRGNDFSEGKAAPVPYRRIDEEAAGAPIGSSGLLFLPFLAGRCSMEAGDAPAGAFSGLRAHHGRAEMSRAILEGIAFEIKSRIVSLEALRDGPFDVIRVTGGGASSLFWLGIMASIFDRDLEALEVRECTSLGAAILGAVGSGYFPDLHTAARTMVHNGRHFSPERDSRDVYSEVYARFESACAASREARPR